MDTQFKEKLEEVVSHPINNAAAEDLQGEAVQEELPQQTRGRKKQVDENSRTSVYFKWPWDWDACLDHYLADRKRKEHRHFDRTGVIVQLLKEFLTKAGYKPSSGDS